MRAALELLRLVAALLQLAVCLDALTMDLVLRLEHGLALFLVSPALIASLMMRVASVSASPIAFFGNALAIKKTNDNAHSETYDTGDDRYDDFGHVKVCPPVDKIGQLLPVAATFLINLYKIRSLPHGIGCTGEREAQAYIVQQKCRPQRPVLSRKCVVSPDTETSVHRSINLCGHAAIMPPEKSCTLALCSRRRRTGRLRRSAISYEYYYTSNCKACSSNCQEKHGLPPAGFCRF